MRYRNQTVMHGDTKDTPAPKDTAPLGNIPPNSSMIKQDSESSARYSKVPDPHHDLTNFLEHFQ